MIDDPQDDDAIYEARAKARLGSVLRDKYCLERVLGIGGMATVYAATHRNGKEVALKLLHPELAHHPDVRTRFLREGYVANQVKHDGAVSVIDDDVTEEGWAFLVMELLEGMTVQGLWEARGLRVHPAWVTSVVLQLLDVMAAAHENGIIHRDIKPANLFVTKAGELKVLDFGIARMRDMSAHTTVAGSVLGTPAFMAPEQAMAQSKEIDQQTDLWAVGSVAFALLSGEVVHPAENSQQTLILAATQAARELGPLVPDLAPSLTKVFDRALAFRKAERWSTAKEMRDALIAAATEAFGTVPETSVLRDALSERRATSSCPVIEATMDLPSRAPVASKVATAVLDRATLRGVVAAPGLRKKGRTRDIAGAALFASAVLSGLIFLARLRPPTDAIASVENAAPSLVSEVPIPPAPSMLSLAAAPDTLPDSTPSPAAPVASDAPAEPEVTAVSARAHEPKSDVSVATAPGRCTPPFVIDPRNHRKIWKMECL